MINSWSLLIFIVTISDSQQIDILFQDEMSSTNNFYKSPTVQFVSDELCASNICAKMPASTPATYLETKIGNISTIGYIDIVLKLDLALTGFGLGFFKIYYKIDASQPYVHIIQIYDHDDLNQNTIYHNLTFNLPSTIENNDKLGIHFMADAGSIDNTHTDPYVFIDNLRVLGTKIPTPSPTSPPTLPTISPTSPPILPCGGMKLCFRYYDGCNTCYNCNESGMSCGKLGCSLNNEPYCKECIEGYFINVNGECEATTNPTYTPTIDPTYIPTVNPTPSPTDSHFGVSFNIRFQYDSNMTNAMLLNITHNLLDINNDEIDENCINSKDYDIRIDNTSNIIIINGTIFVCDKQTETELIVYVTHNLTTDLLNVARNNPKLFVPKQNISIDVGIINKESQVLTTSVSMITTKYNNLNMNDGESSDNIFVIIMAIIGSIIFICITVILIVFVYKARKDNKAYRINSETNHDERTNNIAIPSYKIGEPTTGQKQYKYQLTPTQNDNDDERNPFDNDDNDDINDGNPTQIIFDDNTIGNDNNNKDKLTQIVFNETKGKQNDNEMFVWLRDTVGLNQYYQQFINNGYQSFESIKGITDKTELINIGINNKYHITKLMNNINSLKIEDDDEIIIDDNTPY